MIPGMSDRVGDEVVDNLSEPICVDISLDARIGVQGYHHASPLRAANSIFERREHHRL